MHTVARATPARTPRPALYRPTTFVSVRAPRLPVELCAATGRSAEGTTGDSTAPGTLLPSDPRVRACIAVGSPSLYERLRDASPASDSAADLRAKLLRYLIRMSTRPTPFGLFAGIGQARWGADTDLVLAPGGARTRTRPDMEWLASLVARLEARVEVRRQLRVQTNPAAFVYAGRVVLSQQQTRSERDDGATAKRGPVRVNVRATSVVLRAMELAQQEVAYGQLAESLLATSPGAEPQKIDALLTQLWQSGLLLTELRPAPTERDAVGRVLERLSTITGADDVRAELEAVVHAARQWDGLPDEARAEAYLVLARGPRAAGTARESTVRSRVQVDTRLGLEGSRVQHELGTEAARAAEILLRMGPSPCGLRYLVAYREAFLERYEASREVPLLELLDADCGLAYEMRRMDLSDPKRDPVVLEIATRALHDRQRVVELDDATLRSLQTYELDGTTAPPSLDVNVLVAAASREALARGAYQLVVGPVAGAQAAGRLLGRFSDMLPQAEGELAAILEVEEQLAPGTLCAEIVDVPLDAHGANVLLRTPVAQHEVPVGGRASVPADRVVPLRELVVGVRNDRFYVRWPRKNVDVVLRQGHMLNNVSSIGLVKFLADVSRDGCPVFTGFQWGPAKTFPFLPRVQVGRLVLSLAQWRLSARVVQGELRAGDAAGFGDRLGSWRKHWNVPRHVYLSDQDNRLLLDLEQPAHVEELRREMRCCPEDAFVELQEGLPGPDDAWLEGEGGHYVCELTVSVVQDAEKRSRTASAPAPVAPARELPPRSTVVRPPGSEWLYLKLYVAHFLEEDLISGPVRKFAQHVVERGLAADWFFVRYADPSPHVRLRFRGDAATRTASLVPVVLAWLERLVAEQTCQRFVIDTYDREVERYGGVHGIGLAERIAAIDSAAVAGLLEVLPRSPTLDRADLAVLTVTDLLAGLGLDDDARLRWLKALGLTKARSDFSADYRLRREALLQLLRRPGEVLVERARAGREVVELLRRRKDALAGVAGELETAHREGRLTQPPAELFRSYIHMHLNRLLGINPEAERRTYGLLLRAHESLPHGAPRARPASSSSLEP